MQARRLRSPSGTLASPRAPIAMGLSRAGSKPWTVLPDTWQKRKHPPTARRGGEHGAGTIFRIEESSRENGNRIGVRVAGRGDGRPELRIPIPGRRTGDVQVRQAV